MAFFRGSEIACMQKEKNRCVTFSEEKESSFLLQLRTMIAMIRTPVFGVLYFHVMSEVNDRETNSVGTKNLSNLRR